MKVWTLKHPFVFGHDGLYYRLGRNFATPCEWTWKVELPPSNFAGPSAVGLTPRKIAAKACHHLGGLAGKAFEYIWEVTGDQHSGSVRLTALLFTPKSGIAVEDVKSAWKVVPGMRLRVVPYVSGKAVRRRANTSPQLFDCGGSVFQM